jgi:membrane glycosyltransferase
VELDAEAKGSAEDAPPTFEEFHRRDRRWCQGNIQHLRLLAEPGLHPMSRFHMAAGVFSYLAAPVWLALMLMGATGAVDVEGVVPLLLVALLLMVPKICGLIMWMGRRMTPLRRRTVLRAFGGELLLSAVIAPVMMVRQSLSVLSILVGRDCGWKSGRAAAPGPRARSRPRPAWPLPRRGDGRARGDALARAGGAVASRGPRPRPPAGGVIGC